MVLQSSPLWKLFTCCFLEYSFTIVECVGDAKMCSAGTSNHLAFDFPVESCG